MMGELLAQNRKEVEMAKHQYPDPDLDSPLQQQKGGDHYKKDAIQPVEFAHSAGLPFIEGSVVKYVSRHRRKGGVEDIRKAIHFLEMLIELEYKT